MKKMLYFEGAGMFGCEGCGDLNNPRIRTAFHLDDGTAVYLEILRGCGMYAGMGFIDRCATICEGISNIDAGFDHELSHEFKHVYGRKAERIYIKAYTTSAILNFVNALGCSFDGVEVLPDLAGYRVFASDYVVKENGDREYIFKRGVYNYGDEFKPDRELIEAREALYKRIYEQEKARGVKYPCFSLWVDEYEPARLHFHNCRKGGINCPAFFVGVPQDLSQLPTLNASNAMEGCYYGFCNSWIQVTRLYSFTEKEAQENECVYLDRFESRGPNGCTVNAALVGSRIRKTRIDAPEVEEIPTF